MISSVLLKLPELPQLHLLQRVTASAGSSPRSDMRTGRNYLLADSKKLEVMDVGGKMELSSDNFTSAQELLGNQNNQQNTSGHSS
jgi:hypothetical protein